MPTLLTNSIPDSQKSDVDRLNARLFAQFHRAYAEASDDVQEIIHEMVQIINDPAADENEKNAAADTLLEALFPSNHQGTLGIGTPIARERELLEEHKRLYGKLPRCNERIG